MPSYGELRRRAEEVSRQIGFLDIGGLYVDYVAAAFEDLFEKPWVVPPEWDWTHYESEQDWLESRLTCLGASEVGGILEANEYTSPWKVWGRLIRQEVQEPLDESVVEWGNRHEACIAGKFADVMQGIDECAGCHLVDPGDFFVVRAPGRPWLACTPDRLVVYDTTPRAGCEMKTAQHGVARDFRDHLPLQYRVQTQVQMHCLNLPCVYYAVLLWGSDFRWYVEERHDGFMDVILRKLDEFWECVERKKPPPEDFSLVTSQEMAKHYNQPDGTYVDLPPELEPVADNLEANKAKVKELERLITGQQNKIKGAIQNAEVGVLPGGRAGYSWKKDKRGRRVLRRVNINEGDYE